MKPRLLDLVLLVALVVVSGAIVWTLFSLGRGTNAVPTGNGGNGSNDAAMVLPDDDTDDGNRVVPVAPGGAAPEPAGDGGETAIAAAGDGNQEAPDDTADAADDAPGDDAAAGGDGDDDGDDGDAQTSEGGDVGPIPTGDALPAASEAGPPPDGEVALERIGFSFVTGGAGACGVTLEPWEHVAVSRELLDAYGCGAEITVTMAEPIGDRTTFQATVADTMNETFSRTVNVYVGEDEPAMAYGLTRGDLVPGD